MGRGLVLHVVEALGGGVASALNDYVRSTHQYRHAVLAYRRPHHQIGDVLDDLCIRVIPSPEQIKPATQLAGRWFRRLQPDVVHAHSSYAGVQVRMSGIIPVDRIVYTPHCYAFERRDLIAPVRGFLRSVEGVLGRRTSAVAAVSPREAQLAAELSPQADVVYVPNVARVERQTRPVRPATDFTVVTAGRLLPQKDPNFFLAVVHEVRRIDPGVRFVWLGGDPEHQVARLRAAGVEVSGWIPRSELLDRLATGDVYLHTAAWEGAPITILEAAAMRIPIVVRDIPALASLDVPGRTATAEGVADELLALRDPTTRRRAAEASALLHERHPPAAQAQALSGLYERVMARTGSRFERGAA